MGGDPWGNEEVRGKKRDKKIEYFPLLSSGQSGETPPLCFAAGFMPC